MKRIYAPSKTRIAKRREVVHLALEFASDAHLDAFFAWMREAQVCSTFTLSSGLMRYDALWEPEDAEKVEAFIGTLS